MIHNGAKHQINGIYSSDDRKEFPKAGGILECIEMATPWEL